jgi:hypothetical protein
MKKCLLVSSILMLSITVFADNPTVAEVATGLSNGVETVVHNVNSVVTNIDTASLYKQVYGDFKNALVGIADALKVGVEHVYKVLVMQQVVKSIVGLVTLLVILLAIFLPFNRIYEWTKRNIRATDGFVVLAPVVYYMILLCWFMFGVDFETIVTGFVNPEYGAMSEIMEWVTNKTTEVTSNKCNNCN